MENEKMKIFELKIDENEDLLDGVTAIAFVEYPAIEKDFMFFSNQNEKYIFTEHKDKYIVSGPAMIPNQRILRLDKDNNEYEVFFKEETIEKCSELFFKRSQHNRSNVEHLFQVDGVSIMESWLIEDPSNDKSNALGFSKLPKGTWMVSYKVENKQLWEDIKSGKVKGFSIEGKFIDELINMNTENKDDKTEDQKLEEIYKELEEILKSDKTDDEIFDEIKDKLKD